MEDGGVRFDHETLVELCEAKADVTIVSFTHYSGNVKIVHGHHWKFFFKIKAAVHMLKEDRYYIEGERFQEEITQFGDQWYSDAILLDESGHFDGIVERDTGLSVCWSDLFKSVQWEGVFQRNSPCNVIGDRTEVYTILDPHWAIKTAEKLDGLPPVRQFQGCPNLASNQWRWGRYGIETYQHLFQFKAKLEKQAKVESLLRTEASEKLYRIRNKPLKINPMQIFAATQTIKTYASNSH